MRKLFLILPVLLFAAACGGRRTAAPAVEEAAIRKMPPAPAAPGFVSDPQEASEYVLSHFWKAFLDTTARWRCDSAYVMGVPRDDAESAVGMYVTLMETSVGRSFARPVFLARGGCGKSRHRHERLRILRGDDGEIPL